MKADELIKILKKYKDLEVAVFCFEDKFTVQNTEFPTFRKISFFGDVKRMMKELK